MAGKLEDRVREIIVEQLGVNAEQVTMEASFIDDLGADSLDSVELIMAFEEEFGAAIPEEAAEKLTTVGKVIEGTAFQEPIKINLDGVVFPAERVALAQKFFDFADLTSCGDFRLYVFVFSSTKHTTDASVKPVYYTSIDTSITFERSEQECKTPEPESSSAAVEKVCTPVTPVEVELSNSTASTQKAINFGTGLATDPHVTLKISDSEAYFEPSPGVTIYEDNSQTTGLRPEVKDPSAPICKEDFVKSARTYDEELNPGLWLEIVTPDGNIYPVMIRSPMFENATKGSVTLVYYK